MIQLPTVDDVLNIHEKILLPETGGGLAGVRDQGAIQAAIHRASTSAGGVFVFSDVFAKTAAIVESLVGIRHPFVDGNKRTGAVVAGAVLLANGYELDVSDDELEALMLGIAGDSPPKPTTEEIANWLRDHSAPLT